MSQDTTRSIQKSATRFLSGTMLSRMTGMLRDMAMAFAFGTESAIATFMVAFRFAHLARRLFGEGSLQNTFIPHFEELRQENPIKAFSFFRDLGASLILILMGLIVLAIGSIVTVLVLFTFDATTTLLLRLVCWMLPSLLFICLYGMHAALLECEKSYFTPSVAPVAFNCVWIIAACFLAAWPPSVAVVGLAIGVIWACAAQWAFTLPLTMSIIRKNTQAHFWKNLHPFSPDVRRLIGPLFLANLGVAASQINNALDPLFALFASTEGPAWLWYAIRIQQLPLALFGIALSGALLPPISRAIKSGDMKLFRHFFQFAEMRTAAITIPISAAVIATAPTCVNLLFGRGQFTLESVQGTASCLIGYSIGIFPMTYILIAAPILYAFNDYKTPTRASITAMVVNVLLNAFFIFGLGWGALSVAVATSFAALGNALQLHLVLKPKKETLNTLSLIKIASISGVALGASLGVDWLLLGHIPLFQILQAEPLHLSQEFSQQLLIFGAEASTFLAVLGITAYLSKTQELLHLLRSE